MIRIKRVGAHSFALTMGIISALGSLVFVIPMFFMFSLMSKMQHDAAMPMMMPFSFGMVFFMPVIYFILGYIFSGIFALVYNLIAKMTGGIKVEFEDDSHNSESVSSTNTESPMME